MVSEGQDWSTDSMRASADTWTLADDVSLREYLVSFGQKLEANYKTVLDSFENLDSKIETSSIYLGNVTNRLGLLSNLQFVESRVSDEDETSIVKNTVEQTSEENSEQIFCQKTGRALADGANFVESAFVTIDFEHSDSEDEEVLNDLEPIYESRNVYHLRHLPHIIGSQKFLAETSIGLQQSSDEKEETSALSDTDDSDVDKDEDLPVNLGDHVSDYSLSDEDTEEESLVRAKREKSKKDKSMDKKDKSMHKKDNLLLNLTSEESTADARSDSESIKEDRQAKPLAPSFVNELSSKIGVTPPRKADQEKKKDSLFDSESDDELFGVKFATKSADVVEQKKEVVTKTEPTAPQVQAQKIGTGFLEAVLPVSKLNGLLSPPPSDEGPGTNTKISIQENLPKSALKQATRKDKSIFHSGSSSGSDMEDNGPPGAFNGSSSASATQKMEVPKPVEVAKKIEPDLKPKVPPPKTSNLFDSDSDDEGLFATKPPKIAPKNPDMKTTQKSSLFSSGDEDEIQPPIPSASKPTEKRVIQNQIENSHVTGAPVLTGPAVVKIVTTAPAKKVSLFEDSSSDDDLDVLFKKASKPATNTSRPEVKPASKLSLFSESDDETSGDIFGNKKSAAAKVSLVQQPTKKSLFSDDATTSDEDVILPILPNDQKPKVQKSNNQKSNDQKSNEQKLTLEKDLVAPVQKVQQGNSTASMDEKVAKSDPDAKMSKPIEADSKKDLETKFEKTDLKEKSVIHEPSISDDEINSTVQDEADGNIMSTKSSNFKSILNAKIAKGPVPFGKQKSPASPSVPSKNEDVSSSSNLTESKTEPSTPTVTTEPQPNTKSSLDKSSKKPVEVLNPNTVYEIGLASDSSAIAPLTSLTKSRAALPAKRRAPTRKAMKERTNDETDSGVVDVQANQVETLDKSGSSNLLSDLKSTFIQRASAAALSPDVLDGKSQNSLNDPTSDPIAPNRLPQKQNLTEKDDRVEGKTEASGKIQVSKLSSDKPQTTREKESQLLDVDEKPDSNELMVDPLFAILNPDSSAKNSQSENKSDVSVKAPNVDPIVTQKEIAPSPKQTTSDIKAKDDATKGEDEKSSHKDEVDAKVVLNPSKVIPEEDSDDDLFGPPPMPDVIQQNRDPLFGTPSSDEEDLFGERNPKSGLKPKSAAGALFDDSDEDDDDLFATH